MTNNRIKSRQVKLIIAGEEPKLISTDEAMEMADEQGLDLVVVNDKDDIPYVKIMDYQKYVYEQKKKQKNNKKNNRQSVKEVRITAGIADNDLKVKAKAIDRILSDGDKVSIQIRYPGRMIRLIGKGYEKIEQILSMLTTKYKIEREAKIAGNTITIIIKPC